MKRPMLVRKEYKNVCNEMNNLVTKGIGFGPLPEDTDKYCRLAVVKKTLEWVHPYLIKTKMKGANRLTELLGHKHYAFGPTFAVLYP